METILYLDFETGGLDPSRHAILQAAWILERFETCEILVERRFDVYPDGDVNFDALSVNEMSLERIGMGKQLSYVLCALKADLASGITGMGDCMIRPCGHNIQFDLSFLSRACKKYREPVDSYLSLRLALDTCAMLRWLDFQGKVKLPSYNLETACHHFGIEFKPHDALEDVHAVRKLFHALRS